MEAVGFQASDCFLPNGFAVSGEGFQFFSDSQHFKIEEGPELGLEQLGLADLDQRVDVFVVEEKPVSGVQARV